MTGGKFGGRTWTGGLRALKRAALASVGGLLILYGVVALPTPLPLGALSLIIGFLLFGLAVPAARHLMRRIRSRVSFLDQLVRFIGAKMRGDLAAMIEETDPARRDEPKAASPQAAQERA